DCDSASAGFYVAVAAPAQGRLRSRGAHHRPAARSGSARPTGWIQTARRPHGARGSRPHLRTARVIRVSVRALAALTFLIILSHESAGQDSAGAAPPPLPLDPS